METFGDKSEGNKSIHCAKTMFTKYLILDIIWRNVLNFSTIIVCCYSDFR